MNTTKHVLVVLRMTGISGRDFLTGILRYARPERHWNVRILQMPGEFAADECRRAISGEVDGLILSEPGAPGDTRTERLLCDASTPTVMLTSAHGILAKRKRNIAWIGTNDTQIGKTGATLLTSLGHFQSWAFVKSYPGMSWTDDRSDAFVKQLEREGKNVSVYTPTAPFGSEEDLTDLAHFLITLPQPTGIMSDHDARAVQVLNICNNCGIKVPYQLAVVGVDNDTMICDFTSPPLTSIKPDHEHAGFLGAKTLDGMMRGKADKKHVLFLSVGISQVVERESTEVKSRSNHLVERALAYIAETTSGRLSADDVADHLRVSRRLLDLRFHETRKTTVSEAIRNSRLEKAMKLVKTTKKPISRIAAECGFADPFYLMRRFRTRYGVTLGSLRRGSPIK